MAMLLLTWVSPVVLGPAEDLQGPSHVTQVELVLQCYEDLDRLEVESIRFLNDCTWREGVGQRPMLELVIPRRVHSLIFGN